MDGASFVVPKSKKDIFMKISNDWCEKTTYELEYTYFKKIFFQNVNSYIAVKTDDSTKKKGKFMTDTELHKNKSFRIIPLALEQYFSKGIKPEDYIKKFNNMYDFCGRVSSTNTYYLYDVTKQKEIDFKLIRYYPCHKSLGSNIMKIVREDNDTNASDTNVIPAESKKIICNYLDESVFNEHLNNVDRDWFIQECYNIINPIEAGRKLKSNIISKNQLTLF